VCSARPVRADGRELSLRHRQIGQHGGLLRQHLLQRPLGPGPAGL